MVLKQNNFSLLALIAALLFALPLFATRTAAQGSVPTILHSFSDGSIENDGASSFSNLIQASDGNFYGTTFEGGSTNNGVVFKMTPAGVVTILHSFMDGSVENDGAAPQSVLLEGPDGNFYGTTFYGGSASSGSVFKITPAGAVTILHSFADGSVAGDGAGPLAGLTIGLDGDFYGTTNGEGSAGVGTVFKMTPAGAVTILHSFGDGSVANDGYDPYAGLTLGADGNFYGTTSSGGATNNGVVYSITTDGVVTILHSFADGSVTGDGTFPQSGLVLGTDGNFYGTANNGSAGQGIVYRITPAGSLTILHTFGDGSVANDGYDPYAGLTLGADGNFYGTTTIGGATMATDPDGQGFGTLYRITPAGAVTILHSFGDGSVANDGIYLYTGLTLGSDGNFYGTTYQGGSAGLGTVFRLPAVNFVVNAPANATEGAPFSFTVTAYDLSGNVVTGYAGTIHFTSTDGAATLPADAVLANGVGTFSATFATPGSQTITATDTESPFTGNSGSIKVGAIVATHLVVSAPLSATAGSAFNVNVTAEDDSGNIADTYSGTVHFTSTDPTSALHADTVLTKGTGSFSTTLYTAAPNLIRARDTATATITGTAGITINPDAVNHFTLTTPTTATSGLAFYAMLSARDQYENVIKSFIDTIHISSTDPQSVLPANFVLTSGAKQVSIKLQTPGTQTITATDTNNSMAVTSGSINVGTIAAKYVITGPATSTVGAVNTYTITAKDTVGNTVNGYTGTVHLTSTDPNASLPSDMTLINGTGTFQVTFQTKGAQKVNANDTVNSAIKGLAATTVK